MKRLLLTLLTISFYFPISALSAIKCWTNNEGVRECGNYIPPKYSQQESRTINNRGLTTDIQNRALTDEERAVLREKEEQERIKREAEELARQQQAAYDRVLLATFLTTDDIIKARDRNLEVIDGYISNTNSAISKLEFSLNQARKDAANSERRGQIIPESTLQKISNLEQEIATKKEFIATREEEKETLRQKYDEDYKRFVELKKYSTNR